MMKCAATLILMFMAQTLRTASSSRNKFVVVAMSGLRYDFINDDSLPTLKSLRDAGVYVKQLNLTSITNTFPSLWTLVTGLKSEEHGILDNAMRDPDMASTFQAEASRPSKEWFASEPIWITAERQGIKTAVSSWPGAGLNMDGFQSKYHPYVSSESLGETSKRVEEFSEWMGLECDLGFIFLPEPDNTAQRYGPSADQVTDALTTNDNILKRLLDNLGKYKVMDRVNVIVIGDHGMSEHRTNSVIYLSDYGVRLQHLAWVPGLMFTTGMLLPHQNDTEYVYTQLKRSSSGVFEVYKREDIPEDFGIKRNRRCTPILMVPAEGYRIEIARPKVKVTYVEKTVGLHGYAPSVKNMKAAMVAQGPDFLKTQLEGFSMHEFYPMICSLMNLKKCHGSQGTLENAKKIVKNGENLKDLRGPKVEYFKDTLPQKPVPGSQQQTSSSAQSVNVFQISIGLLLVIFTQL